MAMIFRKLKSIIKQGFQGMWRNRGMGLASVSSIAAVLVILGIVLILVLSVNTLVADTQDKIDEVEVFLVNEISDEQKDVIRKNLEGQEGVLSVITRTKDQAIDILKKEWGEDAYLLEGLEEDNPLPESFVVQLKELEYADEIVENIKDLEGIDRIRYHKEAIEKLLVFADYVQKGGLIIIVILISISIFIISNTIKLTVNSRSREINIMKYVGATNGYIKGPFIIEGVLFGVIGAVISMGIIYFGYGYLFDIVNERLYDFFQVMLVPPTMIFKDISIIFISIGAGIGALGSVISMKRFLNV